MAAFNLSILLATTLATGCAAIDFTGSEAANDVVGKCYEFVETGELIRTRGSDKERVLRFTWTYLFLSGESQNHLREDPDGSELLMKLNPGTKLRIEKVVSYPYGSAGRCWIVKATLLGIDTNGEFVEIPSCRVWDRPIWVAPDSPYELESNPDQKLRIDTPILTASTCTSPAH